MDVKIVSRAAGNTVVEWHETAEDGTITYSRAVLPSNDVPGKTGTRVEVQNPGEGIPYGEPWQELLQEEGVGGRVAFQIANELHRMGIWTLADLTTRSQDAVAAFQRGYAMDVQRLRLVTLQRTQ